MNIPSKTLEKSLFAQGYDHVIGIDEVGMGCLAGPVVVCAVALSQDFYDHVGPRLAGVRDSKLMSESQREAVAAALRSTPGFQYRISLCQPATIDRLNIYQAARHAMRRTVRNLGHDKHGHVLIDGNKTIQGLELPQRAVIKGDQKVFAIACASVMAKVHRDRMMKRYARRYPGYDFEVHKGYGTPKHLARLAELGPCELHRKSFAPVAKFL